MVMLADVAGVGPGDLATPILILIMGSTLGWFLAIWTGILGCFGRKPVRIFRVYLGVVATASLGMNVWFFDYLNSNLGIRGHLLWPSSAIVVTLGGIVLFLRATTQAECSNRRNESHGQAWSPSPESRASGEAATT